MASLAGMLKQRGHRVTGSDQNVYPPISHFLRDQAIPVIEGYRPENLHPLPDLVIVGNVITRNNPEAVELSKLDIAYLSLPQALRHFAMAGKRSIVITGTHGKTTTSSLSAWMLERAGLDPGFMIGGIPNNFDGNFKLGKGPYFIIEGDEYDTAFFDKGPKFLHYAPWIAVITSIEFDHADIYRDLDHIIESFRNLIDLIPADGRLIINGDDPIIVEESERAKCPVTTYGFSGEPDWRCTNVVNEGSHRVLQILKAGKSYRSLSTPLLGNHNISNLLSVVAMADFLKIDPVTLGDAAASFRGVKRRLENRGDIGGILVLDDFAHHPTSVNKTIHAVKERYGDRRLIAVFEPRSNSSRRNIFQKEYASAFDHADVVLIPEPSMMEKIPPEERFSSERLVENLKKNGLRAAYSPDTDHLLGEILKQCKEGDIVLIMSNGPFDNLVDKLVKALERS